MTIVYVLGTVVCAAVCVVSFLFYLLSKESSKDSGVKAEPIVNPQEILGTPASTVDEEAYRLKIEQLEAELHSIAEKGTAQAREADAMVQQLTRDNELLREEYRKKEDVHREEFTLVQQQTEQLRQANSALQIQLANSDTRLRQVQEEGVALRNKLDDELAQSEAVIAEYKRSVPKTEDSLKEMEELRSQVEGLRQEVYDLQLTNTKLKEFNQHLMDKADALQYELVKHRAQASGLERICESYKLQLEKRA